MTAKAKKPGSPFRGRRAFVEFEANGTDGTGHFQFGQRHRKDVGAQSGDFHATASATFG